MLVSEARPDIMRWKYAKLLMNLLNAVDALFAPSDASKQIVEIVRAEGETVLRAAGIAYTSKEEDTARRGDILQHRPIHGRTRTGARLAEPCCSTGSIETDYLNGEISLLGRLHGVPTPANAHLQLWARRAASAGTPPGTADADEFLTALRVL
jgi:2-dehydropantoate 2-reductase